jgi:hypothetical protein
MPTKYFDRVRMKLGAEPAPAFLAGEIEEIHHAEP